MKEFAVISTISVVLFILSWFICYLMVALENALNLKRKWYISLIITGIGVTTLLITGSLYTVAILYNL